MQIGGIQIIVLLAREEEQGRQLTAQNGVTVQVGYSTAQSFTPTGIFGAIII
jgi:hypothetical protein